MAKLDQSFIKAYGHVGVRPNAPHGAAPAATTLPASAPLPSISAAPIVVDASSFAIDTVCSAAYEPVLNSRRPPTPLRRRVRTSRHRRPQKLPSREGRRTPAKHALAARNQDEAVAAFATTFHADSFSVDSVAAELQPPVSKPAVPPKPVETKRQPPRLDANHLCHRACTVQFSTIADTDDETAEETTGEDAAEIEANDEPIYASLAPAAHHAAPRQPTQYQPTPHHAESAPRIDGVAYHRMSAPAAPSLRTGYEVDAFRWPEVVNGLGGRATTALSTLIDELVDASSIGRGVVMFAGERRGAGATTLAAYAARRLAQLGLSVALVDADYAKPALARSLGVAVEYGWDDSLEAQADFTAAMIASLNDGVTILPLRHAAFGVTAPRAARIAADLAVLRKHFALVILDGGPLAEVAEPWLAQAPEDTIDCGIVVRDVRIDATRHAPGRPHAPRSATLPAIGVVENFVTESPATKK